jgi:hypothetical protein
VGTRFPWAPPASEYYWRDCGPPAETTAYLDSQLVSERRDKQGSTEPRASNPTDGFRYALHRLVVGSDR